MGYRTVAMLLAGFLVIAPAAHAESITGRVVAIADGDTLTVLVEKRQVKVRLPEHLPREHRVHEPACNCPDCGTAMRKLGEDVSEVLDYVPGRFKVIRHVRPKHACPSCQRIVQVEAPSRPIERGFAGAGYSPIPAAPRSDLPRYLVGPVPVGTTNNQVVTTQIQNSKSAVRNPCALQRPGLRLA